MVFAKSGRKHDEKWRHGPVIKKTGNSDIRQNMYLVRYLVLPIGTLDIVACTK